MNTYSIVQFASLAIYLPLAVIVLRSMRTRVRRLFLVYLLGSMGWSFSSFMAHANFLPDSLPIWGGLLPVTGLWAVIAYYHFISSFTHRRNDKFVWLGYAFLLGISVIAMIGLMPKHIAYLGDGEIAIEYGHWLYVLTAGGACFWALSAYHLARQYRNAKDALNRTRSLYLLVGLGLMFAFAVRTAIPPFPRYPVEQLGHLCNAIVIIYAITRYQLFDIKVVVRKGLVYSLVTVCITAVYLLLLFSLHYFLQGWTTSAGLGATIAVALLMAWLFNPLRTAVQKGVDRLFYGERYDYREMVRTFAHRMSNVLDLDELAEAMLQPITKAVRATHASLLLPDATGFSSQYGQSLLADRPFKPISFRDDSPVVKWLCREEKPLTRNTIETTTEFKALWDVERQSMATGAVEVLCPIKGKGRLIGILALGKKHGAGFYSNDDLDLLMTLATEAAVAMENAQLYDRAKQRAHTDELTGLYNHRYFHERLDEEISRCTRFGEIFSLLFMDLDLFKAYNDIYGHIEGDGVLRDVGRYIQSSIRGIDIAFRYGGDEFTVILPQASLEDARHIGERVRRKVEQEMDSKGAPLSCSVGLASWPTDGVMREEIIRAADAALYHAKQTGRDRVVLFSELGPAQRGETAVSPDGEPGILSTIYALAATVDAKDSYTYGHSKKVAKYATDIAEELGYSPERIATLRAAALLHDIGKIGISDELLVKVGPLNAEDWEPIRSHPKLGVAIIKHVESLGGCLAAIQYHHERFDGSGYPSGLKGENIPMDARILAVADSYDAMTSLRPYRHGRFTHEQAVAELKRCSGTQFDPQIVEAFVRAQDKHTARGVKSERTKPAQALVQGEAP